MHMDHLTSQSLFLAGVHSETHGGINLASFQTIALRESSFGAMIYLGLPDERMRPGHKRSLLHMHTSMLVCVAQF